MDKIIIRKAKKADSKSILNLIDELAEFEKLAPPDVESRNRLIRDAFSKNPPFRILVAEINSQILGYAFYLFTYSSFKAKKTLYLEDIYITDNFRKKGIGKLFFEQLVNIAAKNKCGRMEWVVLDWNVNAIKFYDKTGAKELSDWKTYRLDLQ